jgi:ubiquinone/menaquinone biosynthesis C-methylase UbiE
MDVRPESLFYHEHLARYRFAETYIRRGRTLDIATGTGYGANLLCQNPEIYVVGADIDRQSLREARQEYPDKRIGFLSANGSLLPFQDDCFQNIVTLETIEHIADDYEYSRELARILHPDGVCVLSTPNREHSEHHHRSNPYHVREYSEYELIRLLRRYFTTVDLFYQGFADRYYRGVSQYAADIQSAKQQLNPLVQFIIDNTYRPMKQMVPTRMTNFFIRKLLKRTYPQPSLADIVISPGPLEDTSVFIAVCQQPRNKK